MNAPKPPTRFSEAVAWLSITPREKRGPAVPELRRRYHLSAAEACQAIREASLRKAHAQ